MKKAIDYKWHNYWGLKALLFIWPVIPWVGFNKHFDHYLTCNNWLTSLKQRISFQLGTRGFNSAYGKQIALPLGLRKDIDKEC